MKKLIFSVLIAAHAIRAVATTPVDKLPAIVIDTLYEAKGSFVVEYEVLRPFDRVHLIVQPSNDQTVRGVNPVLLSGNTGKSKTSVPISLATDEATHFNVFIAGGQFADKGDIAEFNFFTFKI